MSTITFGDRTFAILANQTGTISAALADRGTTHIVKLYDGGNDFSGDQVINGNDRTGTRHFGLLIRIDRDRTSNTVLHGNRLSEVDCADCGPVALESETWGDDPWLPLYLVRTADELAADEPTTGTVTTAGRLRVGDVFSVEDDAHTTPLYLATGYGNGELLTVVSVRDTRDIRFRNTAGATDSRGFEASHRVRLHSRGPVAVGDVLPNDTAAAALLVGLGGRFRPTDGTAVYEVTRLPGMHEHTGSEDCAQVMEVQRDGRPDGHRYPLVTTFYGQPSITVVRVGPEDQPAPTSAPVLPGHTIPRTATEAIRAAGLLQDLARFLPGGELESTAHEHAAQADLCGSYEAIVCPTFGWTPRNGDESSSMRFTGQFFMDLDQYEASNATLPLADRLAGWMVRYERGGFANVAVVDHARNHLEQHKVPGADELLENVLHWDTIGNGERDYEVTVRFERTRTITEYGYHTVTVTAEDDDQAHDLAIDQADEDYVDWDYDDEDIEVTDRHVSECTEA